MKFCWAQTKGHTQKNGHDRNGGVHDFFYSPIQFGSEKDIVAGGGHERQWRVGYARVGESGTSGLNGPSGRSRRAQALSLIHSRPLGLLCRFCPLTALRPHCIVPERAIHYAAA